MSQPRRSSSRPTWVLGGALVALAAAAFSVEVAVVGLAVAGLLVWHRQRDDVARLQDETNRLRQLVERLTDSEAAPARGTAPTPSHAAAPLPERLDPGGFPEVSPPTPVHESAGPVPARPAQARPRPSAPDPIAEALRRAWAFASGGNPLVRVGLVIVFVGVGVGLRFAAEAGLFPLEARLLAAALIGVALGAVGLRERSRRPAFGLALQGGGIAVLYLTLYAAGVLFGVVPVAAAVLGMALVAVACGGLAVWQDAPALALLGVAGGFAAPVLAGTEAVAPGLLFAYYGGLNLGVLGIAWTRGWRSLAVVGFASSFVTGTWWGGLAYTPALYPVAQPFVVLTVAVYLALAVRFAVRTLRSGATPERALAVDGALVFGLPAAAFVAQLGLVEGMPYGRAWSAAALAGVYLAVWAGLRGRPGLRPLSDALLAVGLTFATVAVPLAVGRIAVGAVWALEGAALVWTGARQGRAWMRAAGLALQAAAAGVLFAEGVLVVGTAFSAASLTGPVVAASLGLTAWVLHRADVCRAEAWLGRAALGFGLAWWTATAVVHAADLAPEGSVRPALVALAGLSALAFLALGRGLGWADLREAALLVIPAGVVLGWIGAVDGAPPVRGGGWAAWPVLLGASAAAVVAHRGGPAPLRRWAFAGGVWLLAGVVAHQLAWSLGRALPGPGWAWAAVGLVIAAGLAALPRVPAVHSGRRERRIAARGLAGAALVWAVAAVSTSGTAAPLPTLPLLNPLDLALVAVAAALVGSARWARGRGLWATAGAVALVGLLGAVARGVVAVAEVPYTAGALWTSAAFQGALSVAWTALALGLTVVAARRASRATWFFGAGVLALVVAKLFLVDLAQARALEIVGAFVVVGLLVLGVGYRSPLPPKRATSAEPESDPGGPSRG